MKRLLLTLAVLLGMATTMAAVGEEKPADEKARLEAKIEELTQRLNQMQKELVELQKESRPVMVTRVYDMADIVLPTKYDSPFSHATLLVSEDRRNRLAFESRIDSWIWLVRKRIVPSSWKDGGTGEGNLASFPTNMTLVVNQSEAVHVELAAFFNEIRQAKQQLKRLDVGVELSPQPKWK